jgi:hypothetical protein
VRQRRARQCCFLAVTCIRASRPRPRRWAPAPPRRRREAMARRHAAAQALGRLASARGAYT